MNKLSILAPFANYPGKAEPLRRRRFNDNGRVLYVTSFAHIEHHIPGKNTPTDYFDISIIVQNAPKDISLKDSRSP